MDPLMDKYLHQLALQWGGRSCAGLKSSGTVELVPGSRQSSAVSGIALESWAWFLSR